MNKPIAYAAVATDASEAVYDASLKEQAEACCRENGWFLLPLYAAPPTWQEEVAAVEAAFERSGVKPTWPADEAGNIGPMAAAMADEINRQRLTDEERGAVEWFSHFGRPQNGPVIGKHAATLRGLLGRLK